MRRPRARNWKYGGGWEVIQAHGGWRLSMAGIGDEVKPRFGNCCGFSEIAGTEKNFESLRWLQEVVSCDREDGISVLQLCIFREELLDACFPRVQEFAVADDNNKAVQVVE
ncbi:hypothetical protein M0R45_009445 [Rubus argutus]|uniref:Uncharacterized protein n=1 Tax=Rubus argutus TaxID=59490 RepID=A0AAW1Y4N5_RUBAR